MGAVHQQHVTYNVLLRPLVSGKSKRTTGISKNEEMFILCSKCVMSSSRQENRSVLPYVSAEQSFVTKALRHCKEMAWLPERLTYQTPCNPMVLLTILLSAYEFDYFRNFMSAESYAVYPVFHLSMCDVHSSVTLGGECPSSVFFITSYALISILNMVPGKTGKGCGKKAYTPEVEDIQGAFVIQGIATSHSLDSLL
ncbi:hypothetical protein STEG23_014962, partial [Scotinomys teguina]